MPASWIPIVVPLRAISDTTLDPSTAPTASQAHLHAAIVRLRKKWWLPATKRAAASPPRAAKAVSRSRIRRLPVAWLRMCSSSPMFSPWPASESTSTGPRCSSSRASVGPRSSRKKRRRSTASSSATPNHRVRPGPSFSVENARAPPPSTIHTGIEGEHTPVIGPTWSCSLPGSSAISPAASIRSASERSSAQPSNTTAASSARRWGSQTSVKQDRRSRVQEHAVAQPRHHRARRLDADGARRHLLEPLDDALVGRRHAVAVGAPQPLQHRQHRRDRRPRAAASRPRSPVRPAHAARRRRWRARR